MVHTKLLVRSPGKLIFRGRQWTHETQRHPAQVPEDTIEAWSRIQQSITDQATDQWRDHLNACVRAKNQPL